MIPLTLALLNKYNETGTGRVTVSRYPDYSTAGLMQPLAAIVSRTIDATAIVSPGACAARYDGLAETLRQGA